MLPQPIEAMQIMAACEGDVMPTQDLLSKGPGLLLNARASDLHAVDVVARFHDMDAFARVTEMELR